MTRRPLAVFLALALALALTARAQPGSPQSPPAPTPPPPPQPATVAPAPAEPQPGKALRLEDLPPPQRLGVRAEAVRQLWPVIPAVVIVPDGRSYLDALSHWTPAARFPILIDDGTPAARENIARFVRAFTPERTLRFNAPAEAAAFPDDPASRRAAIQNAIHKVWSNQLPGEPTAPAPVESPDQLLARWRALKISPPGIVITDPSHSSWPAAIALALGHTQLLAFIPAENNFNGAFTDAAASRLAEQIEAACAQTGLPWDALGDTIDAITLCLNTPARVQVDSKTIFATTDLIGRLPASADKLPRRESGPRWAWTSQIAGSEERSAYAAMSALFLQPSSAWLFDGYPDAQPWNNFDATKAEEVIRATVPAWRTDLDDSPRQSERQFKLRASPGVNAGFIAINTKGSADEFNLEPGRCRPGDLPFLHRPAIVYIVHSFSAAVPGERATVAGRWLERGAYAYLGSVYEPFLQAFVPTPVLTARVLSTYPWAAAVRPDSGPAWRLACFGDPLITLGPKPAASTANLPLPGARDLKDELARALRDRRFDLALSAFAILGQDADAARLAAAILKDDPKSFTPQVAAAALLPLARARDARTFFKAYAALSAADAADPVYRDALWHIAYTNLGPGLEEDAIALLRLNLRADQPGRDAAELSSSYLARYGRAKALDLLTDAISRSPSEPDRAEASEAMKRLSGSRQSTFVPTPADPAANPSASPSGRAPSGRINTRVP
jgi:hypothetical protein